MSTYVQVVKYMEDKFLVKKPDKKKKKKRAWHKKLNGDITE